RPDGQRARVLRAPAQGKRCARHRDARRRARGGAGAGAVPADEWHRVARPDHAARPGRHLLAGGPSGGAGLSGLQIANADKKSVLEIAREAEERVARIRARRDQQVERTKSLLDRVPTRLLGRLMRVLSYLIYDLDLDLSRFGVVKDEFGTAMVTNVGV